MSQALLAGQSMGVGSILIAFGRKPGGIQQAFGLPPHYSFTWGHAVGYPLEDASAGGQRVRLKFDKLFNNEAMGNPRQMSDGLEEALREKGMFQEQAPIPGRFEEIDRLAAEFSRDPGVVSWPEKDIKRLMKDEDWDQVLDTNLSANFRLTRTCLKPMFKARRGRVINITSVVGVTGNPGQANYAAAKAGLIGMSKSLAQELASRSITVNCVAPGFIATPMTDVLTEDQKKMILGRVPAERLGTPDEIAAGVVYLASDEAAYVSGQTLHINGGMAMI